MRITSLSLCLALGAGHFVRVEWGKSLLESPDERERRLRAGNRPEYLIDDMEDSELKTMLNDCLNSADIQPSASDFSIGHRGACLQFPEHTLQS